MSARVAAVRGVPRSMPFFAATIRGALIAAGAALGFRRWRSLRAMRIGDDV